MILVKMIGKNKVKKNYIEGEYEDIEDKDGK